MSACTLINPPNTEAGVVYCLCFPSGKKYIGISSRQFKHRAIEHIKNARYEKRSNNAAVTRAIRKYGVDSVKVSILAEGISSQSELCDLEQRFIKEHGSFGIKGYNMTSGGEGPNGWFDARSEQDKLKIREKSSSVIKSLWKSDEFRRKVVDSTRARAKTDEFRNAARDRISKLNANPEFVKKRNETLAKSFKTEKWTTNFNDAIKRRSENKDWVSEQGRRIRAYYADPENNRKHLENLAIRNADPEFQKRRLASCRESWKNPDLILQQSERNKARAKIKESDYHQVLDLYSYGFNGKEIARMYEVKSHQTIYNILAKNNANKTAQTAK